MSTSGTGAPVLKLVAIAGLGVKANPATAAVTLRLLAVNNTTPIKLQRLSVTATGLTTNITGVVVLHKLSVAGIGKSGVTQSGAIASALPKITVVGNGRSPYLNLVPQVLCITGFVRSDGSALFQFQGKPGVAVEWSANAGNLTPLTNYTNSAGQAFARWDAGGFTGNLTVEVQYGS